MNRIDNTALHAVDGGYWPIVEPCFSIDPSLCEPAPWPPWPSPCWPVYDMGYAPCGPDPTWYAS